MASQAEVLVKQTLNFPAGAPVDLPPGNDGGNRHRVW